jgi:hypothetical protein
LAFPIFSDYDLAIVDGFVTFRLHFAHWPVEKGGLTLGGPRFSSEFVITDTFYLTAPDEEPGAASILLRE